MNEIGMHNIEMYSYTEKKEKIFFCFFQAHNQ